MAQDGAAAALSGVKVLEIAHYIAGPHCTMMLADQGAEVVKLEPLEGDASRHIPPGDEYGYACHNRRKRSVALDLRRPEAREPLDALLRWADLVVTNYSAGVPERLGFGFERLSAINPRAVMVHITGYGSDDPRRDYVAYDGAVQAMSGFSSLTRAGEGPPVVSQVWVADHTTAVHAAFAAACALQQQRVTGRGRKIEVSMLRSMTSFLSAYVARNSQLGSAERDNARFFFGDMFATADSHVYAMPLTLGMWRSFCELIGRAEWGEALVDNAERKAEVIEAAQRWFRQRSSAEAMAALQARRIACGAARSVSEICEEERSLGSGVIVQAQLPGEGPPISVPGPAFSTREPEEGPFAISALGADTLAVLAEAGLGEAQLSALARAGVLRDREIAARAES